MIQRTFVAIKPDGVKRGLVGEIIKRFENAGLKIIAMKMFWADRDFIKKHYKEHVNKPFYPPLEDYLSLGPVVAMVLEGVNAISVVRKIVGSTEPSSAPPGTIRGDFAHVTFKYADSQKKAVYNLIHASGNESDAEYEINLWFKPEEIHDYKVLHESL